MSPSVPILGIGNAIVDILSFCDEAFLQAQSLQKGSMSLIDEARADALYAAAGQATECSGGSAANTLAGIASLGGETFFIGKVRDDTLGGIFRHDMQAAGSEFSTQAATSGPATARCLVFVTPDGERTMATYLGACSGVTEADIDETHLAQAGILYIEGYLWDLPEAKAAIKKAIGLAKSKGCKIALTLSDVFCVERHRESFHTLIAESVDILLANEQEVIALYPSESFDAACEKIGQLCTIAAITRGAQGCVVVEAGKRQNISTPPVVKLVDTTGAGDLFASGFLYGLSQQKNLADCAKLGNACAGHIIQQLGARAQHPLKQLVAA